MTHLKQTDPLVFAKMAPNETFFIKEITLHFENILILMHYILLPLPYHSTPTLTVLPIE